MEAEAAAFSKWTLFTYYLFEKFLAYLHFIKVTKSLVMFKNEDNLTKSRK